MPDITENVHAGEGTDENWANNVRDWLVNLAPTTLSQDRIRVRAVNDDIDGYINKHIQRGDIWRGTARGRRDRAFGREKPRHIAWLQTLESNNITFSGQSAGPGMLWHISNPPPTATDWHWGGGDAIRQDAASPSNGGVVGPWYHPRQRPSMLASIERTLAPVIFCGFGTGASFGIGPSDMIAFIVTEAGTVFTRTRNNGSTEQERVGTMTSSQFRNLGIWMPDTDTVQFFINGELVAQHTQNIPEVPIRFRCGFHGSSQMLITQAMCWSYEIGGEPNG